MKNLIKKYLDSAISRRDFLSGLGTIGITSFAANSMASSLAPFQIPAREASAEGTPTWMKPVRGSGGALFIAQLKAAGVRYLFVNSSASHGPIYDALVDEPDMQVIAALQEGSVAAMADGYARVSGKTGVVMVAFQGLPNCMAQMAHSWSDNIPMVVTSTSDGDVTQKFTKSHWVADRAQNIPDATRRAFMFASTQPCGPAFLEISDGALSQETEAVVMDQTRFSVSMQVRPDAALVERAARLLLEARSPLIFLGDEIALTGAEKEVVELAELLSLPVTRPLRSAGWSRPFPTRNPLYLGDFQNELRYPGEVDVMLNLGGGFPLGQARGRLSRSIKQIYVGIDPRAVRYPTELSIVANLKLATADLVSAIRSMATPARLQEIRDGRYSKTAEFTSKMRAFHRSIGRELWDQSPMALARLGMEMESILEKDTCLVVEHESSRAAMHVMMDFGGDDKYWVSQGGGVLGHAVPASFGVKLALPDRPVVAVTGDGAFLFNGPQPLWTFARYHAPVTVIVVNNHSYNGNRNRMWSDGGRQFQAGRDMACYIGDPDIDFAKMATTVGVEGEVVREPSSFRGAMERAKRAAAEGRPYLLDVHVARYGLGATTSWHPPYSVAALRTRKV